MEKSGEVPRHRTRVIFFLILSAAVLWAVFLLQRGEMLQFTFMFASLAAINPLVAFIDIKDPGKNRALFLFYILILVALLWAAFLLILGIHLWVSLFIFIIAIGIPLILRVMDDRAAPAVS
ncbi:MAG: hypothetical protein WCX22_05195 [Methanoregula sp.]|jgi:hypothetical protein